MVYKFEIERTSASSSGEQLSPGLSLLSHYTHIYIASLFYSYLINLVLYSSLPTIRNSYKPRFTYRITKLLKFTYITAIALASLYRSLTQNILRLLRIYQIRQHYYNLVILIISIHFLSIKLTIKLLLNYYLIQYLRPRDLLGLSLS